MKKNSFVVYNLANSVEYTYCLPTYPLNVGEEIRFKIDSLIRTYMLENNQASQILYPEKIDHYRCMVSLGEVSAALGDLAVNIR